MLKSNKVKRNCIELDAREKNVLIKTKYLHVLTENLFYAKANKFGLCKMYSRVNNDTVVSRGVCREEELPKCVELNDKHDPEVYLANCIKHENLGFIGLLDIEMAKIVDPDAVEYMTRKREQFLARIKQIQIENDRKKEEARKEKVRKEEKEIDNLLTSIRAGTPYTIIAKEILLLAKRVEFQFPPRVAGWIKKNVVSVCEHDSKERDVYYHGTISRSFWEHYNVLVSIVREFTNE